MKISLIFVVGIFIGVTCHAQSKEEREILQEGNKLYKTEMASWYGTDIFLERFGDRREKAGGYFSYLAGSNATCVFFSKGENPKVIGTFTFDSTYNVNSAVVDGQERELTKSEVDLLTIRQVALNEYRSDTLFKSYQHMNPNFVPLNDEKGKRVYVLTGPQKQGVVVFGNDYLITFDQANRLISKKRLHKNIISADYGNTEDGKAVFGAMHTHLPETGDLITATDVCTLMLYGKYTKWAQYIVISDKNVSLWNCQSNRLVVMPRKAWDKINDEQKKR